jgi:glutamate racemase
LIKLGVFDSGLGGLTVYRALRKSIPCANILYLGDTARVPYGTKSAATVTRYAIEIAHYLVNREVEAMVVACNTASAYAMDVLRKTVRVPVFGVVEPGAQAAVKATRNGIVGVVGTRGTVSSGAYQRAIEELAPTIRVLTSPCPLFVPLVEEGWLEDETTHQVAHRYLEPLIAEKVDTLVLGCTHYPLLKSVISKVMGDDVVLIDSAEETSFEVKDYLECEGRMRDQELGGDQFEVTDSPSRFAEVGRIFLDRNLEEVFQVNVTEGEEVDGSDL